MVIIGLVIVQVALLAVLWKYTNSIERSVIRVPVRLGAFGFLLAPSVIVVTGHGVFPGLAFWLLSFCITQPGECGPMDWQLALYPSLGLMFLLAILGFVLSRRK